MNKGEILNVLSSGLNRYEQKVHRKLLEELVEGFLKRADLIVAARAGGPQALARQLLSFASGRVEEDLQYSLDLRKRYAEYAKRYSRATSVEDQERHILGFSHDLGRTARQLKGDKKAFARFFGHDAVVERYHRRQAMVERRLSFFVERIGTLAEFVVSEEPDDSNLVTTWVSLKVEASLKPLFTYDGDSRVTTAAFRALARALRALPLEMRERAVDEGTLQFIYRAAMHPRLDCWLQCEAVSLLESLSVDSLERVIVQRLSDPVEGDDLFVRKRVVGLLCRNVERIPELEELLAAAAEDPSAFVRQGFANTLADLPEHLAGVWLSRLALGDSVPQVRAAALLMGLEFLTKESLQGVVLEAVDSALRNDSDEFVKRVAMHVATQGVDALAAAGDGFLSLWSETTVASLEELHVGAESVQVRRWAAMAREQIWCRTHADAWRLRQFFADELAEVSPSQSKSLPRDLFAAEDDTTVGRTLSVLAQENLGIELTHRWPKWTFTRGHVFGFRLWRFLHEVKRPATDKRQAFRHTVGRLFGGDLRAPSSILCELAETRVPGEPLFVPEEGGWRPYVPLVDEAISAIAQGFPAKPLRIFTSEGVTTVLPPKTVADRVAAYWALTRDFAEISKLRNWKSQSQEGPATYVEKLKDLGFEIHYGPHQGDDGQVVSVDPAVGRFFPSVVGVAGVRPGDLGDLWNQVKEYVVSAYDNSLFELAVFTAAASTWFLGQHIHASRVIQGVRSRIPLVVGGWGTRGKSGTERLKAALFNALGYGIVSKTTGCEAMFLYAHPFGETRELFLFRSYDKATIWEQHQLMRIADKLGAEVFLWECMALTPAYVDILQRHWVRDDISTITNTYPDHEDLQGPAGINIPQVMSLFVPQDGKILTTEDQMVPILEDGARKHNADMARVSWLEIGLLCPDVLKRFPYDEHPNNIALILTLAEELGVDKDFALKEMADRVVPDLGVLKTTPTAAWRGRRLQFTNGCSANERHGAMGNWTRLGFDSQDSVKEPGVWITAVVNNRADRVPRSKVFARLVVEDFPADRILVIGGNVQGFVGFVAEAWENFAPNLTLWPEDGEREPVAVLREWVRRFRFPSSTEEISSRLGAYLGGLEVPQDLVDRAPELWGNKEALCTALTEVGEEAAAESILREIARGVEFVEEFRPIEEAAEAANREAPSEALDQRVRELFWTWFQKKLVVVDDYYVSGDQLIETIGDFTPAGTLNRILGLQNIKGTGLDFV